MLSFCRFEVSCRYPKPYFLTQRLLPAFSEAPCFLQDVRAHMAQHGGSVVDLQRQLLERLCGLTGIAITNEFDGEAEREEGGWDPLCVCFVLACMLRAVHVYGSSFVLHRPLHVSGVAQHVRVS